MLSVAQDPRSSEVEQGRASDTMTGSELTSLRGLTCVILRTRMRLSDGGKQRTRPAFSVDDRRHKHHGPCPLTSSNAQAGHQSRPSLASPLYFALYCNTSVTRLSSTRTSNLPCAWRLLNKNANRRTSPQCHHPRFGKGPRRLRTGEC